MGGYNATFYINRFRDFTRNEKADYLNIADENGYAPAMEALYYRMNTIGIDKAIEWIHKTVNLGYAEAAYSLFLSYSLGEKDAEGKFK